jgi:large subunit ribosomal protein L16
MGKGKGPPEAWVAVVRPGRMLFEMEGIPRDTAREALRLASHKLSVSTQFCERRGATYAS